MCLWWDWGEWQGQGARSQIWLGKDIHEATTVLVIYNDFKTWGWVYLCLLYYSFLPLEYLEFFIFIFLIWGSVNWGHISKITQNSNPRLGNAKAIDVCILAWCPLIMSSIKLHRFSSSIALVMAKKSLFLLDLNTVFTAHF